jgi:exodeoxyribonuclease VII small subunit
MPKAPAVSSTATPEPVPASYEAALGELEALVSRMESGNMPLDALLKSYQTGAQLLGFCQSKLAAVEDQIKVLDNGSLKPWMPDQ